VKHGTGTGGRRIHYFLNYSGHPQNVSYAYADGADLLTGKAIAKSGTLAIAAWDLAIVEERQ
jgi:hypothetical protein